MLHTPPDIWTFSLSYVHLKKTLFVVPQAKESMMLAITSWVATRWKWMGPNGLVSGHSPLFLVFQIDVAWWNFSCLINKWDHIHVILKNVQHCTTMDGILCKLIYLCQDKKRLSNGDNGGRGILGVFLWVFSPSTTSITSSCCPTPSHSSISIFSGFWSPPLYG